uniref:Uncharacterized protein n=2 Tax=environmental samples TaxID=651140 RepID=A0A075HYX6_9ARCH|nr:hypothetical protein [uncultured marine thaumarchaeote SAT1000_05_A05]AIF21576.1 hypothetical protein [uncultured marine thaumarchaeote SAT1000_05_B05]
MFLIYALARNGRPKEKEKTIRFLIILLIIGVVVGVGSSIIQGWLGQSDPLKVCIEDRNTPYKISVTLELYIDGNKAAIPGNIGFGDSLGDDLLASDCQRTIYTLTDDGTIYVEWEEEYPFEIGHFLWVWEFPIKDMDDSKTRVMIDGKESDMGIHTLLKHGSVYKAEFYSEGFDQSKESDFLPPDL